MTNRETVYVNGVVYDVRWHWDTKLDAYIPLVTRRG